MKVTIKSTEWATYKDQWRNKQMPVWLLGWYPDYIDPDNYTAAFAGTAGSKGMGINFSDPEWDALFTTEQSNTDAGARKAAFEKLQTAIPTVYLLIIGEFETVRDVLDNKTLDKIRNDTHICYNNKILHESVFNATW